MKIYRIKTDYKGFIGALLLKSKKVIAPVFQNDLLVFGSINKVQQAVLPESFTNTIRSVKEFVFPVTEPVLKFSYNNKELKLQDILPDEEEKIILGLRPCDTAALNVVDDLFNYQYKDEFFNIRRNHLTIISVACEQPDEACFCTTASLNPASLTGCDMLLKKNNTGGYIAYVQTEKGNSIINLLEDTFEEVQSDADDSPIYKEAENKIRPALDPKIIHEWLDKNFDNPLWDKIASRCLGCASCAFLCPTCHCFDIADEMKYSGGLRRKNWDACQFPLFTAHASGHNPRKKQSERYRQRIMHKFKYYSDRFDKTLCTGCGRCIRACPVNLDIYEVLKELIKSN